MHSRAGRRALPGSVVLLLCLFGMNPGGASLAAGAPAEKASEKSPSSDKPLQTVYILQAGDELEISVWGHPDLSRSVQIREDGTFAFPLIGSVLAADRPVREVETEVQERLNREYIVNPQVLTRLTKAKFSIFGEVTRPGSYPIEGAMDLLTAISLAGGITKFGSSSVAVIREQGDGKVTLRAQVDRILNGSEPNVEILPNDTIHVRRRIF